VDEATEAMGLSASLLNLDRPEIKMISVSKSCGALNKRLLSFQIAVASALAGSS
jgi:hypothetical protein